MHRISLLFSLLLVSFSVFSQELNCEIVVNADRITSGNDQVFKTLETSLNEFVNQTTWTNKNYQPQERIVCSMIITINEQKSSDFFSGSIQVQSSRPVFNSIYTTPLINIKDNNFNFKYIENQPLLFDANTYQSELVSVISYYVYFILGVDGDSYALNGGDKYFDTCKTILDQVENSNDKLGWKTTTSKANRYHLLDKVTSSSNTAFRKAIYDYHRNGLDVMEANKKEGKNAIYNALIDLKKISHNTMSSMLYRFIMDAKVDEVVSIFTDGPQVDNVSLVNALNKISPTNANKWAKIK